MYVIGKIMIANWIIQTSGDNKISLNDKGILKKGKQYILL